MVGEKVANKAGFRVEWDMTLSKLQRNILQACRAGRGGRINRTLLRGSAQKIITRSLERLIDKGLLVGYGLRTPQKWYIKEIRLTSLGRKAAKKLRGEQSRLPFLNS